MSVSGVFFIKDMIIETIVIVVISFTINHSTADIFAKKFQYKIKANQELIASGLSNIFASFFSCFTGCASLSRTYLQVSSGGKTQVIIKKNTQVLKIILYFDN